MPAHLCAFTASISPNTETELSVVQDDVLSRSGDTRFFVPADVNNIHWAAALSANLLRAKIEAPSLITRRITLDIIPHVRGAIKFPLSYRPIAIQSPPVTLTPTEAISVKAIQGGTAAERVYALIQLGSPTIEAAPAGDVKRVRAISATTLKANEWTTCPLTLETELEAGTYALVGMIPISANAIAARAIIRGQVYRPGVPALAGSEADVKTFEANYMQLFSGYLFGTFTHTELPQIQFLSSAADTSEVVYLYVVKTG
jgi:hypothetical protein